MSNYQTPELPLGGCELFFGGSGERADGENWSTPLEVEEGGGEE